MPNSPEAVEQVYQHLLVCLNEMAPEVGLAGRPEVIELLARQFTDTMVDVVNKMVESS